MDEKGCDEVVQALLVVVPKVKIKIGHRCISGLAQRFNFLDDRGTDKIHQSRIMDGVKYALTREYSFRSQLESKMSSDGIGWEMGQNARIPSIQRSEAVDFHSWKMLPSTNQVAAFLRSVLHASLWLTDGSGGESHSWMFFRNWSSKMMCKAR